ncbi:RuBisCO large subunit C-terminal-like domain-containing protein [Lamprobacter modestohalophilus]|uniref:RuBisCO large subunit C-terminal-like domain-containing protein n=1 Tax=Lamprobacter modestohalophilus TaxID=1064514 RepID=UPI002ADEB318|nr:RuBisCO large subunit C-terminal-like domain-containing protein [Lamprobacter modestohalophilus]MEA1050868.1 RuBisCO large subunit C-terminal-like domain-containing protein [Lamprobacter modestohalophilus]
MKAADIDGFYSDASTLDAEAHLILDYRIECSGDPRVAAAHLCSEQSTAQWRRVDVDEDYRPRFAAKVLDLEVETELSGTSYPLTPPVEGPVSVCRVRIAHPHANFGPRIPNLLSAILGEGPFFAPDVPLIKLLDIQFPDSFLAAFEGPQFGLDGLRECWQIHDRPFFFGVIKPNIGLAPEPFAELGYQGWLGGLDIAKDDEMLADPDWSPIARRSALLGAARQRAEQETGEHKVYLANITDEVDRLLPLHDLVVANGANAVMVNALPVGLSAVRMLRKQAQVPLVAHFPLIAASSRLPYFGVHTRVWTKLQRLAGFDVVIMPGFGPRMMTAEDEVLECIAACVEPMGPIKPCLPVPGGSDSAVTLPGVHEDVGNADFGFVPGRGVFSHPMGPRGGAASLRQAWEAIAAGVPLAEHAAQHPELAAAIGTFG